MIKINDEKDCCGCWACYNVCPKHCISMVEDKEGFRYPKVNLDVCIDCGLCENVCPLLKPKMNDEIPINYVVQQKDKDVLRTSTSGGFFTAIAKYAIEKGGVVFGAAFDNDMELRHSYSETFEECKRFRGSKYVQSLIGDTYKQAKSFLDAGRIVVFSGTPCQIAGLYGFLRGREYDNLVTVDLVCHGVPSPLLLRNFFAFQTSVIGSAIKDYRSRDKFYGYDFSTATIWFEDKTKCYHKGKDSDIMLGLYFKNICSRPSCYSCHFKTLNRISDITIFDCWDAPSASSNFSREGATNVFIHTEKGNEVFGRIKEDFVCAQPDIETIIKRDGVMIKNVVPVNPNRKQFFEDLNNLPFKTVQEKYMKMSAAKVILAKIKPALYKVGVFGLYLKIKHLLVKDN